MCCLKNEEETYEELNSKLPNVGDYVTTDDGLKGEVQSVSVLRQLVKVLVTVGDEKELREYKVNQLRFKPKRKREKINISDEELKALEEGAVKKLQSKDAEVKKLADSINKQKASLSTAALQDKNIELNKKSVELERLQKDLQTELQTKQAIKLDELFKELDPVISDYAKEKGYDIIFIKRPDIMAYANQSVDITSDIISRFDIKWSKKGTK